MEKDRVTLPSEAKAPKIKDGPTLVSLNPHHVLTFSKHNTQNTGDGKSYPASNLTLTNITDQSVAFKIKTTRPKNYCVKPNSGTLPPQGKIDVQVALQMATEADDFQKHKFLVQTMVVTGPSTEEMWKNPGENMSEIKLKCQWDEGPLPTIPENRRVDTVSETLSHPPPPASIAAKPEERRKEQPTPVPPKIAPAPATTTTAAAAPVSATTTAPVAAAPVAAAPVAAAGASVKETPSVAKPSKPLTTAPAATAEKKAPTTLPPKSDMQTLILLVVVFILGIIYGKFVM